MYCDFYQMRERPFNVTADPKFLYLNARYREAIASPIRVTNPLRWVMP